MKLLSLLLAPLVIFGCASDPTRAPRSPDGARDDERAIIGTIARFSAATAERDFATMSGLFTADAVWEASGDSLGFRHVGSAAIRAALAESGKHVTVLFQQSGPPLVRLDRPDAASARTSITELLRLEPDGQIQQIYGVYVDELVRRDGTWRFARRRFELRHAFALPRSGSPSEAGRK